MVDVAQLESAWFPDVPYLPAAFAEHVSIGKWGASTKYLIEWMCITTVLSGMLTSLAWE